ncbi:MAG TPA: hypothetical protein VFV38_49595, partial [Ktedonobacteraceae bacterium]|nr:hypothetical protein [Ktedonobacteraceae bacterium]
MVSKVISSEDLPAIERAALHLYQIYDIGYGIDLEHARHTLLTPSARVRPVVSRGASIDIPQLPLEIQLSDFEFALGNTQLRGRMQARIYDLGIVALRLVIALPVPLTWKEATDVIAGAQSLPTEIAADFTQSLEGLQKRLAPALERPNK